MTRRVPVEACVWIGGLILMALADPDAPPLRLCLLHHLGEALGVQFCPGCGLGRSIGALARGDLARSWALHPLAIPAVAVLITRSATLVREAWRRPIRLAPLPR